MATYYVHKGVGSDSNNGLSWANCFATLNKAKNVSANNDTIYVRAGATPYYEALRITAHGQKWLADDGHQPVMDGKYHDQLTKFTLHDVPLGTYVVQKTGKNEVPSLMGVGGNDTEVGGFKVCNVAGNALVVTGNFNHVHDMRVDFAYSAAILVSNCEGNLLEDINTSRGSIQRFADLDGVAWGSNQGDYIAICNSMKVAKNCTFRRFYCHHQNGEAMVLAQRSEYCTIEYCIIHNNYHMNIYVVNSQYPTVRYCQSWSNAHEDFLRKEKHGTQPIVFGDESNSQGVRGSDPSTHQHVYGNIFVGGRSTLSVGVGKSYNTFLDHAYIGYNTFVSVPEVTQWLFNVEERFANSHKNTLIENNIFYAPPNGYYGSFFSSTSVHGVQGRNNIFYNGGNNLSIPAWMNGPGTAVVDPKLKNPGKTLIDNGGNGNNPKLGTSGNGPDGSNNWDKNDYSIINGASPAINAGATGGYPYGGNPGLPEAKVIDLWGATRTNPDIGAHEFGGQVTNSVTAAFSRNPSATTLVEGTAVTFTDASFATGTASITGRTWTVKKAGTTVQTATTTNLSYTFATDGSYTVELAVTATGGLTDNEIITYTITNDAPGVVVTAAFSANPSQTTVQQGTVVTFTGQSTVANGTLASQAWAVLELPGGTVVVASGTGTTFAHTFATAGSFRVRLTATAATGQSDTEQRDYTVTAVTVPTVTAAFTSSDADNIINEGESITFTNTSTETDTTLSGYLWTVERVGGGGQASYTTTNITHVFASPGIYTVTLRADTAAGISDTETMTITVLGQTTVGDDFLIVPHTFALATSTGTQTVTATALGTKIPKGVHLKVVGATAAGTAAAGALLSEGAADGQAQWVHCRYSEDNVAVANSWRRYSTARVAMTLDAAGAKTGEASFVKFVAGGMELNISDAFPAAYLAEAVFYAGDGCQFWAGTIGGIGAMGETRTVQTGIDQDAVYVCSSWAAVEDVAEAHADISRGWAVRDSTQYHLRNRDADAADPTALVSRLQPRVASSADGVPGYCSIEAGGFTAGSFTLKAYASGMNRTLSMFAFRAGGHGVFLGMVALPTSGALEVALPFEAQTVQAITGSYGVTADPQGQLGGADAEAIGWHTTSVHGPLSFSGGIASADGVTPTNTHSLGATGFRQVSDSGGDLWNGTAALDVDSFGVTWTAQPGSAYRMILLAVEVGTEVVDPGVDPTADFTVLTETDPGGGRLLAVFDASISNGNGETITAYAWTFGDGTTGSGVTASHLYEVAGEYTATLTVTTAVGSDSKSVTLTVPAAPPLQAPVLVGPIDPATSGGDTPNEIDDETARHTHEIAGKWLKFKPLTDDELFEFTTGEPDPEHVRLAFYPNKFVVQYTDGTVRYIYPTTLPPPE